MNLVALRTEILELFTDDLAKYTTPSGNEIPALYVGSVPQDWRVGEGLEIVVRPMPEMDIRPLYNRELHLQESYYVYLLHDIDYELQELIKRFVRRFPSSSLTSIIQDGDGARHQATLVFTEHQGI